MDSQRIAIVINGLSPKERALVAGANDVKRVHGLLVDPSLGKCIARTPPAVDCASAAGLYSALRDVLKGWKTEDQLVLYFSGHGEMRGGKFCLMFEDEPLPFDNITNYLSVYRVIRAILILDACHSGAIVREKGDDNSVLFDSVPRGFCMIASCREGEKSYEFPDGSFSVFTDLLCRAIETGLDGEPTEGGKIDADDIMKYIKRHHSAAHLKDKYPQTPAFKIVNATGAIWLSQNKSGRISVKPEPSPQRVGVVVNADELRLLYEQTASSRQPCLGANLDMLDWELVLRLAERLKVDTEGKERLDVCESLGLISPIRLNGRPHLHKGAALCFFRHPESLYPQARAVFLLGEQGGEQVISEYISGPLGRQVERLVELILQHLPTVWEFSQAGARRETREIPVDVVREVVSNAISHRNYDHSGHIQIRLKHDLLEVISPGSFPPDITWDRLMCDDLCSCPVDESVAYYLTNLLTFEGVGRGFQVFREFAAHRGPSGITFDMLPGPFVRIRISRVNSRSEQTATVSPNKSVQRILFEGPGGTPITELAEFTGRSGVLADLESLLREGSTACVVVSGIGGVGKTALIRQFVACRGAVCFPDGAAWLDGRTLTSELSRLSRRLGWSIRRDPTPIEAEGYLRQNLSDKRYLLVVDNFDPDDDVAKIPVLGGLCQSIVTSRKTTLGQELSNAKALELDIWSPSESIEFLRRSCPRLKKAPDSEIRNLVDFVGHLPLGVRLISSFLSARPSLSAGSALSELHRQSFDVLEKYRGISPGVVSTFQTSWNALDEVSRRVLQSLAVCARETRTEFVQAISGVDPSSSLDLLITRSLVQYNELSGFPWCLHDVVRAFVVAQPGHEIFVATHLTWIETYIDSHRDPAESAVFSAGVAEAIEALARLLDAGGIQRAYSIYLILSNHMYRVGRFSTLRDLGQMLLSRCGGEDVVAARCLGDLGRCYWISGDIIKSISFGERSLAIYEKLNDRRGQGRQIGSLGSCYWTLGDFSKAVEYYNRALALYRGLGDLLGQAEQLGRLGKCYVKIGDVHRAIECHERALSIDEQFGESPRQVEQLTNLGACYQGLGRAERAVEYHERALVLSERLGYAAGQAEVLGNLGIAYQRMGDVQMSIEMFGRALAVDERMGHLEGQAVALSNLGSAYRMLGNSEEARELYRRAMQIYSTMGLSDEHPDVKRTLGLLEKPLP